jgi:ligand-binding sensor domain-containing protein
MMRIPFTETFIPANIDENYYSSQSTSHTVWSMMQDKSGKIWFGTGDAVYCYNGRSFTRFLQNDVVINKENLRLKMVDGMVEDKNGNIWFASGMPPGEEGVCRYDGKSISSFKPNGDGWIRYIIEDKKGNLWFGGRHHGNFIYDGRAFMNFNEKVGIGNPVLADKKGNIWFSGEEKEYSVESVAGIWCYDGKTFTNFSTEEGMSKYFVWSMLEDRNGNIWIGTRNTGLYKYDGKTFTKFSE